MKDKQQFGVGLASIVFNGVLMITTLMQLANHVRQNPVLFTIKKLFHILLLLFSFCEIVSVASFMQGKPNYEVWTYAFHLLAVNFITISFSLVTIFWSKNVGGSSSKKTRNCIIPSFIIMDTVYFLYMMVLIFDMAVARQNWQHYTSDSLLYTLLIAFFEPAVLAVNSICVVYFGYKLTKALRSHPSWAAMDNTMKFKFLWRLLGTMIVAALCFLLRALLLVSLFIDSEADTDTLGISYVSWWIFAHWIPTIVPAFAFLYIMRKPDKNPTDMQTENNNTTQQQQKQQQKQNQQNLANGSSQTGSHQSYSYDEPISNQYDQHRKGGYTPSPDIKITHQHTDLLKKEEESGSFGSPVHQTFASLAAEKERKDQRKKSRAQSHQIDDSPLLDASLRSEEGLGFDISHSSHSYFHSNLTGVEQDNSSLFMDPHDDDRDMGLNLTSSQSGSLTHEKEHVSVEEDEV